MCCPIDFLKNFKGLHPVDYLWLNNAQGKAGMIFKMYQLVGALVLTDLN